MRHALIADAVLNSIALRPGTGLLVTGSNMSGKSTLLRTIRLRSAQVRSSSERCPDADQIAEQERCAGGVDRQHQRISVIAATHDGELVNLLPEIYDAYHFGDAIGPDGLVFDHRLARGPATTATAASLDRRMIERS